MPDLFEDIPDQRQSSERIQVSRFRPKYRALNAEELALHNEIKDVAAVLEGLFNKVPVSRHTALAMTNLEQAVMWAIKGLTS